MDERMIKVRTENEQTMDERTMDGRTIEVRTMEGLTMAEQTNGPYLRDRTARNSQRYSSMKLSGQTDAEERRGAQMREKKSSKVREEGREGGWKYEGEGRRKLEDQR